MDIIAKSLLLAIMYYIYFEAPIEEQNFSLVLDIAHTITNEPDVADAFFDRLRSDKPEHIALKYWDEYEYAPASPGIKKEVVSILMSKLTPLEREGFAKLTETDDLDLKSLGMKKTALFITTTDIDLTYGFLVRILIDQAFYALRDVSANITHGDLPVRVRFYLEDIIPPDFYIKAATMRCRGMSASILLYSLSGPCKQYQALLDVCDIMLFMGLRDSETLKKIAEIGGTQQLTNLSDKSKHDALSIDDLSYMTSNKAYVIIRNLGCFKDTKIKGIKLPYT